MPKQREERWAKWKRSQPQHKKLRRAEIDPSQPPLLPLFAVPLSTQLAFYGRNQLSSRRRIHSDTELELKPDWTTQAIGLKQSHMAQKPVLRGEVGCACVAREVSVERGGMGERGCARRLGGWVWV